VSVHIEDKAIAHCRATTCSN